MNTLRILLLALLAGTASAGCVWYLWGMAENFSVLRNTPASDDGEDAEEVTVDESAEDTPDGRTKDAKVDDATEVA
ncbi:MAG: hypothetical protein VCD00_05005 [Candidatus Hydrogenedentota bacterium]|jgi:hypothetical protein